MCGYVKKKREIKRERERDKREIERKKEREPKHLSTRINILCEPSHKFRNIQTFVIFHPNFTDFWVFVPISISISKYLLFQSTKIQ